MKENLSGTIEEKSGTFWAYCDQYPTLAAHGKDLGDAFSNMMKTVDQYLAALEASKSGALKAVTSKKGITAATPWRFTLQAA
jgi:predicted RNase H-like HicB family nuclease